MKFLRSIFGDDVSDGLGALTATYQAIAGLTNVTDPAGAIQSLQAAANAAVGSLGPAIDQLSGSNPAVMKLTQQAWQKNGQLAVMTTDLGAAKSLVQQMISLYSQAVKLAQSPPASGVSVLAPKSASLILPPKPAAAPLVQSSSDPTVPEVAGAAGGGLLGAFAAWKLIGAFVAPVGLVGGAVLGYFAGKLLSKG